MCKRLFVTFVMVSSFFNISGQPSRSFRSVDVESFAKAVADSSYLLLDVRTAAEYAEGHIAGTDLNIDVLKGDFKQKALALIPKGRPVALYCRSGNRSKSAARILAESGYDVLELASGYRGWVAAAGATSR